MSEDLCNHGFYMSERCIECERMDRKRRQPDATPTLSEAELKALLDEGEELRREIERRVAPMKRGPFEPPTGGKP